MRLNPQRVTLAELLAGSCWTGAVSPRVWNASAVAYAIGASVGIACWLLSGDVKGGFLFGALLFGAIILANLRRGELYIGGNQVTAERNASVFWLGVAVHTLVSCLFASLAFS